MHQYSLIFPKIRLASTSQDSSKFLKKIADVIQKAHNTKGNQYNSASEYTTIIKDEKELIPSMNTPVTIKETSSHQRI